MYNFGQSEIVTSFGVEVLSGEGTCPPEDCGGVSGYEEILRIINDPDDYEAVNP